ncbi:MAG: type II toxin-antitoxin system PemK/MazF family toxin [Clostridiales bacterium]
MVRRGQIWLADLNPIKGREQAGKRPVLVVSDDGLNQGTSELVIIVPTTTKFRNLSLHIKIDLKKRSFLMMEQLRSISVDRLVKFLGDLDENKMNKVDNILKMILSLD